MNEKWQRDLLGLGILIGLGLLCPLLAARRIPLVDPAEGKHAAIAQEMVERGDWVVPRLLDEPFPDKPILYFWAIAASLKCFGMSEAAVRLPGLLFAALGTLTTAAVAWRVFGRQVGLISGIFYSSMILPLALAQLPVHDVALIPWVNLALLCLWESDCCSKRRTAWAWTSAAGILLGLAILTKGLAGVSFVGIAYGGYLVFSRRLRWIHLARGFFALLVAALVGSSWYLAMEHSMPGFLRYYFVERHLLGFVNDAQPHGGVAWWYYLPILLVGGLPWIAYLPVLLRDAATAEGENRRPLLLPLCWFFGGTLFLTVSNSKFVTYIWPLLPSVAILAAVVWARKIDDGLCRGAARWMRGTVLLTCLLGPLGLPATFYITQVALPTQFPPWAWSLAVVAALSSFAPLVSWRRGRVRLTLWLAAASVCAQLLVLLFCALPQVARGLSGRDLADHFNRGLKMPSRILLVEEQVGSVVFYLADDLRRQLQRGQIAFQNINDPLLATNQPGSEVVAVPERHLEKVLRVYDLATVPYEQSGRFRVYRRSDVESHARKSSIASSVSTISQSAHGILREQLSRNPVAPAENMHCTFSATISQRP